MVLERKERSLDDPDRAYRVGRNNGIGQQLGNFFDREDRLFGRTCGAICRCTSCAPWANVTHRSTSQVTLSIATDDRGYSERMHRAESAAIPASCFAIESANGYRCNRDLFCAISISTQSKLKFFKERIAMTNRDLPRIFSHSFRILSTRSGC